MSMIYYTHLICAAAYLALALFLVRRPVQAAAGRLIVLAAMATAIWALSSAAPEAVNAGLLALSPSNAQLLLVLDPLSSTIALLLWVLFLTRILRAGQAGTERSRRMQMMMVIGVALASLTIGSLLYGYLDNRALLDPAVLLAHFTGRVGLALLGLVLVENLVRNAGAERFWSVKYLSFALGGIFAYDFYIFTEALLFRQINPRLLDVRGVVALLVVPLILVAARRNRDWAPQLAASHRFVFHTATIVGGGVYLLTMGAAGYYIRFFGGDWGQMLQAVFFFAALLMLAVVISSGRFRSLAKVVIAKHLFAYKYDYREEWLRFIHILALDESGANLGERVVSAIAHLVDSPGGALWQWDDGAQAYILGAQWNYSRLQGSEPIEATRVSFLARRNWVVLMDELAASPENYPGLELPDRLTGDAAVWVMLPLSHHERLLGFLVLQRPRVARALNWEDFDLLRTVARQAASYIGEQAAVRALADARQVEMFNQRFAFVIHDIKTMISQLSLLLSNADKHGDNPAFQRDLILSVRDSVDSMSRLLTQINAERKKDRAATTIDLVPLTRHLLERRADLKPALHFDCAVERLPVVGDEGLLKAILGHLVQNAVEAAGPTGLVRVALRRAEGMMIVEVEDNGPGMDAKFIRDQLFRPGNSTKDSGYGIGAYQCRELVRELKGHLTVVSIPGSGTTMRASFPSAGDDDRPMDRRIGPGHTAVAS